VEAHTEDQPEDQAAEELATFSVSHSVTQVDTDTVTDVTSQCPGGSGIPAASATTRDTDSELTDSEEEVVVESVVDSVEAEAEADMEETEVDTEVAAREDIERDQLALRISLQTNPLNPFPGPCASPDNPDNLLFSPSFSPFSHPLCAGRREVEFGSVYSIAAQLLQSHLLFSM